MHPHDPLDGSKKKLIKCRKLQIAAVRVKKEISISDSP